MAYEFKKLSEVESLTEVPEGASVLAEVNGDIKRVPKSEVGGAGGYVIKLENSYINNYYYEFEESYDELYDVLVAGGSVWVDYTNAPEYAAPSAMAAPGSGPDAATNWSSTYLLVPAWCITDVGLILYDMSDATIYYPNGSHNLEPMDMPK